jgi:hypothetical protein
VQPIIDSMLARDPTIHITLSTVGSATSAWHNAVKNYANTHGGIHGISVHYFPSEDATSYGVIPIGLNNIQNVLPVIADTMENNGLAVLVGDFGHAIPSSGGVPTGDPDLAQQWKGAHLCAEMVALMAQIPNIELANHWIFGMHVATWHPIRYNGTTGNYTKLATAQLYETLFPLLLDKSLATSSASPIGTDGNPYSIRGSAFASNDLSSVNLLVVNRDKTATHTVQLSGLGGYTRDQARLFFAASLTSDNFTIASTAPNGSGHFTLPPMSVLVVEYSMGIVKVDARAMLEGPFDAATLKMRDDLRTAALIPMTEPYTALGSAAVNSSSETIGAGVMNTTGDNAVVDWVRLELRPAAQPSTIAATRNALLQRDGDVVDMDGISSVSLHSPPGSYHLAVRHRNHLGVMTANAFNFSGSSMSIDFRTTATYGTNAQRAIGGTNVLWAGNTLTDPLPPGSLKYTGANNDRDAILVRIGGTVPNNTVPGYWSEDVNLDGIVKYTGALNDRDPILVNIGGTVPTNTLTEQLP